MMTPPPTVAREYMVTDTMILTRNWYRRQAPIYQVEMVARVFFAMSASWLRLKLNPDREHPETWFVFNGQRMEFRRRNPDKSDSARVFWLSDIERMAYSLYDFGAIDGPKLALVLQVVKSEAFLYGLFEETEAPAALEPVTAGT
jgi:hypothetical protein